MKFFAHTLVASALLLGTAAACAQEFAPYGTAKVDMHEYPTINAVFDLNYASMADLNIFYNFVNNTRTPLKGKMVVVTHGPELRVFAKENYEKYQGIVDKMAELAKNGVEFRMCSNAMRAAGFQPNDMHGFITVVPAGFPEIALLQSQGYQYINPIPLAVKDVRYLDQPQLKK
ncbi:DsrE family protein [Hydrogenophaga sp. 2FB]|uniref:DsrE family protein n=1 Tax=Hydrogenophaga sp. 2FB TaxID=2502187 RepID=UPI0010F58239|nr:DsrE family protein [Hydrogenophaga sp. 2FB]